MTLPTYSLIKVKEVKNDCYILENGGLRAVLMVSGINFSLLSQEEQNIIISQFKSLLDGLDFPIEILVFSRLENINDYLKNLNILLEKETNPLIKFQIEEYINFLQEYINNNSVMKKSFFVIVPYEPVEKTGGLMDILSKRNISQQENFENQLQQLETRTAFVSRGLSEIGLNVIRLSNKELIELLFEVYNPNLRWGQIPLPILEKLSELI